MTAQKERKGDWARRPVQMEQVPVPVLCCRPRYALESDIHQKYPRGAARARISMNECAEEECWQVRLLSVAIFVFTFVIAFT